MHDSHHDDDSDSDSDDSDNDSDSDSDDNNDDDDNNSDSDGNNLDIDEDLSPSLPPCIMGIVTLLALNRNPREFPTLQRPFLHFLPMRCLCR